MSGSDVSLAVIVSRWSRSRRSTRHGPSRSSRGLGCQSKLGTGVPFCMATASPPLSMMVNVGASVPAVPVG